MYIGATQVLGADHLAGRRLHQRRPTQKDGALLAHDDGLVTHCRYIGAAGGAGSHNRGDLWNALCRHIGLVEEDATEMFAVGEDLVLHEQECTA